MSEHQKLKAATDTQAYTGANALERVVIPAMREGGDWWTRIETFGARQRWEKPPIESDVYVHIQRHDPMRLCQQSMCHAIAANGTRWEWPEPLRAFPDNGSDIWVTFDPSGPFISAWEMNDFFRDCRAYYLQQGRCHATQAARDRHERALIALNKAAARHA